MGASRGGSVAQWYIMGSDSRSASEDQNVTVAVRHARGVQLSYPSAGSAPAWPMTSLQLRRTCTVAVCGRQRKVTSGNRRLGTSPHLTRDEKERLKNISVCFTRIPT
ncbi:hypothetical protein MATL_G00261970 [Megalops atlanticus]|uniref:Uncharacterized protein n=1 Tax=Megalops atlanticus TaxID=7932 RepID=A0A9D3PDA6_MEGAT|nr:hypothetical protein MATL_G00261970 [Megalops atlanticus]